MKTRQRLLLPIPARRCGNPARNLIALLLTLGLLPGFLRAEIQTNAPLAAYSLPTELGTNYQLVWGDEFNGTALDRSEWDFRKDTKNLSTQLPENVSVKDGTLRLTLKKETVNGKNYTGAGVVSKRAFKYGYYETRIKMVPGAGWHIAFWLMKHDGSGTTDSGEAKQGLDLFEYNSVNPHLYWTKIQIYNPTQGIYGANNFPTPDLAEDFHVVGGEFTPETVKFFFDGKRQQTLTATNFAHGDQNIWLTAIASHMGNTPQVDDTRLPATVECDYIRFFAQTNSPALAPATASK